MFSTTDTFRFEFQTRNASAQLVDADATPTGTLIVNGTDNAATVTITDSGDGRYKGSVPLSGLSDGDVFYVRIAATVGGVDDEVTTAPARVGVAAVDLTIAERNSLTAAVADAVWDELLSGHQISGSGADRVYNIFSNTISTQSIVDKLPSGGRNMAGAGDTATNLDQVTGIDAAGVRTAIGMASADLDTQLASLSTFDPTTDEVDADVKKTNGVIIVGTGVEGDEFRGENA